MPFRAPACSRQPARAHLGNGVLSVPVLQTFIFLIKRITLSCVRVGGSREGVQKAKGVRPVAFRRLVPRWRQLC